MDRPNSSYGGQNRTSALRNSRSPPRKDFRSGRARDGSNGKALSPLRSKVAATQQSGFNEEELYERRRQEELRRQIDEKERELENMSHKNQDRLNRHSGADIRFKTADGPPQESIGARSGSASASYAVTSIQNKKRGSNSPLRGSQQNAYNNSFGRSGSSNGFQSYD